MKHSKSNPRKRQKTQTSTTALVIPPVVIPPRVIPSRDAVLYSPVLIKVVSFLTLAQYRSTLQITSRYFRSCLSHSLLCSQVAVQKHKCKDADRFAAEQMFVPDLSSFCTDPHCNYGRHILSTSVWKDEIEHHNGWRFQKKPGVTWMDEEWQKLLHSRQIARTLAPTMFYFPHPLSSNKRDGFWIDVSSRGAIEITVSLEHVYKAKLSLRDSTLSSALLRAFTCEMKAAKESQLRVLITPRPTVKWTSRFWMRPYFSVPKYTHFQISAEYLRSSLLPQNNEEAVTLHVRRTRDQLFITAIFGLAEGYEVCYNCEANGVCDFSTGSVLSTSTELAHQRPSTRFGVLDFTKDVEELKELVTLVVASQMEHRSPVQVMKELKESLPMAWSHLKPLQILYSDGFEAAWTVRDPLQSLLSQWMY